MTAYEILSDSRTLRTVQIEVHEITPRTAERLLEHCNIRNRKISQKLVKRYAAQMIDGTWRANHGQPLSFTPGGVLIDGQHRLAAVIQAGVTVPMSVNFDGTEDDLNVIDTGKSRTVFDVLCIHGVHDPRDTGSAISYYLYFRDYGLPSRGRVSPSPIRRSRRNTSGTPNCGTASRTSPTPFSRACGTSSPRGLWPAPTRHS